jgi:hypothetical protein
MTDSTLIECIARIIAGPYPDESDGGFPAKPKWKYHLDQSAQVIDAVRSSEISGNEEKEVLRKIVSAISVQVDGNEWGEASEDGWIVIGDQTIHLDKIARAIRPYLREPKRESRPQMSKQFLSEILMVLSYVYKVIPSQCDAELDMARVAKANLGAVINSIVDGSVNA